MKTVNQILTFVFKLLSRLANLVVGGFVAERTGMAIKMTSTKKYVEIKIPKEIKDLKDAKDMYNVALDLLGICVLGPEGENKMDDFVQALNHYLITYIQQHEQKGDEHHAKEKSEEGQTNGEVEECSEQLDG